MAKTQSPPDNVNPKRDDEPATLDEAHKREGSAAVPAAPLTQPANDPAAPGFGQSGNVVNAPGPVLAPGTIMQPPAPPIGSPAPEAAPKTDTVNDHGEEKRVVDAGHGVKHIEGTSVVVGGPTQQ